MNISILCIFSASLFLVAKGTNDCEIHTEGDRMKLDSQCVSVATEKFEDNVRITKTCKSDEKCRHLPDCSNVTYSLFETLENAKSANLDELKNSSHPDQKNNHMNQEIEQDGNATSFLTAEFTENTLSSNSLNVSEKPASTGTAASTESGPGPSTDRSRQHVSECAESLDVMVGCHQ